MRQKFKQQCFFIMIFLIFVSMTNISVAQEISGAKALGVSLQLNVSDNPGELSNSVELVILFTVLTLLPSVLIMMTSFTRIVVILSFLKNAMGAQQALPSQVLIGLSLFLTFFIMAPVGTQMYEQGLRPYYQKEISQAEAMEKGLLPLRKFMMKQTRESDIKLFLDMSKDQNIKNNKDIQLEDIPNVVLIPSFVISELKTGFQVGFLLFLPFIVIDMVVASTLMSMGMMMLPPMMISLPFKILLFILIDGWSLVIKSIVMGFN